MPGHHAIILTDASVAFFPKCVSCTFAEIKCPSLGGMKGTTTLKMIPLCMVSASLWCSNIFSASEHCIQLPLLIRFIMAGRSLFAPTPVLISARVTKLLWANQMLFIAKHTWSLSDSFSSITILLKASACVICSLVCTSTHNRSPLVLLPILWF